MPQGFVSTERHGNVLVIAMQREAKRNAVDREMADGLDDALNQLDDDHELWVGILTGTADVFSAGSDLEAGGDYNTPRGGEYGLIRRERRKPLIAAVEGMALGGGFEMVLTCDLVVASRSARFGLPEVTIGALPSSAGLFRGPQVLPLNLARELIVTGTPIDAQRGYEAGFVNAVTEPGGALAGALELAERICANAPLSVQACLGVVNGLQRRLDEEGWSATTAAGRSLTGTADMQEGIQAFLQKRKPRWTGR
jgi:enoyl-CoA hydratase/carnithine racemase